METCKNCGTHFKGKYCYNCGQKYYTDNDKSVKHLMEEAFHFITHFDGTFFTTLKAIFFHPGQLTIEYCSGIRKKYFKPISFYLFIVVLYLLFPIFSGLNMEMRFYKTLPVSGRTIQKQVEQKQEKEKITEEQLTEKFREKSHSTSKIMLFLFIPISATVIFLLYFKRQRLWFDTFILATEINTFYMLTFFLVLPVLILTSMYVFHIRGIEDEIIAILFTILFGLYVGIIFKQMFKSNWWVSIIKGIIFALVHTIFILPIYKTLVFELTYSLI